MATSKIKKTSFGTSTGVNLGTNWTAPSDGLMNVVVGWNNGASYGYLYIKDYTTDTFVCAISNANQLGGFTESAMFPVIKGHNYKVDIQNQVGSSSATFYPI